MLVQRPQGSAPCQTVTVAELTLHSRSLPLFPAAPRLSVPRRAAGRGTASAFPCHVRGFYPGDVTVTWLRDGRVLTDVTPSAPQRNPDGTFNLTLTYTFTPTASDSGSLFSCRVSHAALAQPLREGFPLAVTGESGLGESRILGSRPCFTADWERFTLFFVPSTSPKQ